MVVELAVETLDEDFFDAVLLHPSEEGIYNAGAVGFEKRGVGPVGEDEVAGEKTIFWILLYRWEDVELDCMMLAAEQISRKVECKNM